MAEPLKSRGIYGFAGGILAGLISATIFSVALSHSQSLIFFIVYVTAIPLFVAGLGAGTIAGLLASVAGMIDLLARGPSNHAVLYTFIYALPAFILIALAMRYRAGSDQKTYWYPEGHLMTAIVLYPCVLFLIASAVATTHEGGLLGLTREFFDASVRAATKDADANATAQLIAIFNSIARYAPALIGTAWAFLTMVSMVTAQNALQQHTWNLRSAFTLGDLHLPNWLINVVALMGLIAVTTNDPYSYTALNLCIMLGMPFVFAGLAVVHAWANARKYPRLILYSVYLILIVLPILIPIVMLFGVVDQWADFRHRFIKQTKTT